MGLGLPVGAVTTMEQEAGVAAMMTEEAGMAVAKAERIPLFLRVVHEMIELVPWFACRQKLA